MMFGYQNAIKTAAISSTNYVSGLDPSQLQNNDSGAASMAWQTNGSPGPLKIVPAVSQLWSVAAVARTNLTAAATVSVRVYTDATLTTKVYDPGTVAMNIVNGQWVYVFPASVSGGCLILSFNDPTNPEGYMNIPLVYAGTIFQPLRAISWSTTRGRDQRVDEIVTRSGVEFPQHRWQRRRWSIDAQSIGAAEYPTFQAIDSQARLGGNILFIPDATSATLNADAIFGRLTPKADFGFMTGGTRLTWKADITERL